MIKDDKKRTHIIVTGKGGGGGSDAGAVRFDEAQTLTSAEQLQARENIGVPTEWFGTQAEYDLIDPKDPNTVYHIEGGQPVQSDWNEADNTSLAYIQNKPTIPAAQVNSDWNAVSGVAQILNKPTIPVVPPMDTETLTFTMQDSSTREITFFTVRTGYFYVEDVSGSDNTLTIRKMSEGISPTIEVFKSTDQVNWTSMGSTSTTGITATVPANGKLYLKAIANIWTTNFEVTGDYISCSGNFNIGGNLKSIINGDNFNDSITSNTQCCHIFQNATTLISAANLIMPSEAPNNCFFGMFRGCTGLTTAPVLPATTINGGAYAEMFKNCSALTTAPVISATTFNGGWSCAEMFAGCTSLTTAPALPATTLGLYCYENMFRGCTNLNNITIYANDISATSCVNNWLDSVAATGDFYNLGTATYTADSASGIPSGWTEHTSL